MPRTHYTSVDEYIGAFPKNVQDILQQLRETIRKAAPQAEETISYQMPTYKMKTNLVHFAAFKNHIGFYPTPSAIVVFDSELSPYQKSKGAVRFPIDESLPLPLISQIVKWRVKELSGKE